ncbi:trimethylamine methyltransferase family protein [Mesorhizobium sp. WSM4935]|uniref:trimethylamine methyltransferase family protein n=1 Tax=Mesorhizobium sp. WSM4935 TaxID=3038547 RepID=UPI002414F1F1|nr:trimethylamine methyltransferase family protein [Mesorhizobium sp. WSM4935]MDG4877167.1 trimethylamine methyltransferase family protein [Mesorhizobium sp. WSM4935]
MPASWANEYRAAADFVAAAYRPEQDDAGLETIERAADRVLEETGIRFLDDPQTIDILKQAGGVATGDVVRLDGAELRRIIRRHAPAKFLLRGRNPGRDTLVGGGGPPIFAPIYGAPNVVLDNRERVAGSRQIYGELVAAAHAAPGLTNTGQMICVMEDVPEDRRPLEMLLAHLSRSDKPFMGSIASPAAAEAVIDLTAAAVGRPASAGACNLLHLINASPPLTYWPNPLKCLRAIALKGEASMVSSYMMMGATSPVTVAGALIQGYAEVLAGLALAQLWRPGAPAVMGILAYPFDMRRMLPDFGDPASQLVQLYAAGLGRRLGVPVRGDGAITSAKIDDAQAGAEGGRVLSAALGSGASFILHASGWLEQGRTVSFAKFRRDAAALAELGCGKPTGTPPLPFDRDIEMEIRSRLSPP